MTQTTARHELLAWLGDHALTNEQVNELLDIANQIDTRYPGADEQPERDAALATAYQLMSDQEPGYVLSGLAGDLLDARQGEANALAAIRQAAYQLVPTGRQSEAAFARSVGVDRMAVRKWLGKRD